MYIYIYIYIYMYLCVLIKYLFYFRQFKIFQLLFMYLQMKRRQAKNKYNKADQTFKTCTSYVNIY